MLLRLSGVWSARCSVLAIADAVTEFSNRRDLVIAEANALDSNERLGFFARELPNHLNTATLALSAIKLGNMGVSCAHGAVLERSLLGLRSLIDRSLAEVRIGAGMKLHRSMFSLLATFLGEMKCSVLLEAEFLNCILFVENIPPLLILDLDKDLLFSALRNLLQNAFKFSPKNGLVTLGAEATSDRIRIKVTDNGPGLSAMAINEMFLPFTQSDANKTGLGLGLSIA